MGAPIRPSRSLERSGLTLFEVMLAITISGFIALLGYQTLNAARVALRGAEQTKERYDDLLRTRRLLEYSLRYSTEGSARQDSAFVVLRNATAGVSELRYFTRGLELPYGGSSIWTVRVTITERSLEFIASPRDNPMMTMYSTVPDMQGGVVAVQAAANEAWRETWSGVDRTPHAVTIRWPAARRAMLSPLTVQSVRTSD